MDKKDERMFVFKTSVRFFRNVKDVPFVSRFSPDDAEDINRNVKSVCDGAWGEDKYDTLNINKAEKCDILYWCDENCCSVRTGGTEYERMAFTNSAKGTSVVTNESEHILVQSVKDGCEIDSAYKNACETMNALSRRIPFAVSEKYGFLTAVPFCAGTAMKAGALVHLPALAMTNGLGKLTERLAGEGANLKAFFSERDVSFGAFYQIANIFTLGITEDETVNYIKTAVDMAIEAEDECRSELMSTKEREVYNIVWRSLGVLAVARRLDMKEFMTHVSNIRMGAELGIIDIDVDFADELFMYGQNGYVDRYSVRFSLENETADDVRARIMRENVAPVLKKMI